MLTIIITCQKSHAQLEVGLGQVIFEQPATTADQPFLPNELSYNIVAIHLGIAWKNSEAINYEGDVLATIKKLEELVKTDIIQLLSLATDKGKSLTAYLTDCDQALQKGDSISVYMKQEMDILKSDMDSCIVDKNIADKDYFDAINRYDQKIMQDALMSSIKYETCAWENRIQYNAKLDIATKLVFYLGVLQKKYDVLFKKQDILAQNFQIFSDGILPDLNEIDQILKQYQL